MGLALSPSLLCREPEQSICKSLYHYDELFDEFGTPKEEFCKLYKELHTLPQFPLSTAPSTNLDTTMHGNYDADLSTNLGTHAAHEDEEPPWPFT